MGKLTTRADDHVQFRVTLSERPFRTRTITLWKHDKFGLNSPQVNKTKLPIDNLIDVDYIETMCERSDRIWFFLSFLWVTLKTRPCFYNTSVFSYSSLHNYNYYNEKKLSWWIRKAHLEKKLRYLQGKNCYKEKSVFSCGIIFLKLYY